MDNRLLLFGGLAGVVAVFLLKNKIGLGSDQAPQQQAVATGTTKLANLAYTKQLHWL